MTKRLSTNKLILQNMGDSGVKSVYNSQSRGTRDAIPGSVDLPRPRSWYAIKRLMFIVGLLTCAVCAPGQWIDLKRATQYPALVFPVEIGGKKMLATIDSSSDKNYIPKEFLQKSGTLSVKLPGLETRELTFLGNEQLQEFAVIGGLNLKNTRFYWDISKEKILFEPAVKDSVNGVSFTQGKFTVNGKQYGLPILGTWTVLPKESHYENQSSLKEFLGSSQDYSGFSVLSDSDGVFIATTGNIADYPVSGGSFFGNQIVLIDFEYKKAKFEMRTEHRLCHFLTQMTGIIFEYRSGEIVLSGHQKADSLAEMKKLGVIGCKVLSICGVKLKDRVISDSELLKNIFGKPYCIIDFNGDRVKVNFTII